MTAKDQNADAGRVAAYATLGGAERAVTHLVSLGYDETDVRISPRHFEAVDGQPLRCTVRRGVESGAVIGVAVLAVVALWWEVGATTLVTSVLPAATGGAVGGALVGLLVALIIHRRQRSQEGLSSSDTIAPTRYEIIVERDRDRARHGLAKWWDPAAPPAGRRRAA